MLSRRLRRRFYEALNYRLRALPGARLKSHVRPVSISLLLTNRCNARCVHCDIWKNRGREEAATVEQWKHLLSDLRNWLGPVRVFLTGGEALLRPYATELVSYASTRGLFIEVLTHGYWKQKERIEELARAKPGRVTVSLDAIGATHSRVRGREDFWRWTSQAIATLLRLREEENLDYDILLKTVIMAQNLDSVVEVARYAARNQLSVFYQAIEQNYDSPEDPEWFRQAPTWPRDTAKAVKVVRQLIQLKRAGLPIRNTYEQLEVMIPYFRDAATWQEAIQSHSAHEKRQLCSALAMLEVRPNGDVIVCSRKSPVGNVLERPIREIWRARPLWWRQGCCRFQGSGAEGD